MYCTDFIFDNELLSDHGMIICSFDSNGDNSWSGGNITFTTQKAPFSDVQTFYTSSFESPLSSQFSVCKNPCLINDYNTDYLTQEEYTDITRWLKRKDGYHWLQFNQEGYEDVYYNVKFDVQPREVKGHTIGLDLTITCDSPYGYSREFDQKFTLSSSASSFRIVNNSDLVGIIYPLITITPKSSGNLILNSGIEGDMVQTQVKNVTSNSKIILDGKNDYYEGISDPNKFNYKFPVLDNAYNDRNTYFKLVNGSVDCDIILKYRYIRMVTV